MKQFVSVCLALVLALSALSAGAEAWSFQTSSPDSGFDENTAYILNPPTVPAAPTLKHEIINILMLGVDYGVLTPGRGKEDIKNCHTDSVMMIAVDLTDNRVSLISLPRDTLTYVPGVNGVYKLNAAINCAESFAEGIETVQNTVAWLMGGIRPDHYLVLAPHLVEQIGNKIGGLDIDVEMSYTGHSGRSYTAGYQHLDGVGIMDYARARRNATKNKDDYGRTGRQRAVLNALFDKISRDTDLAYDVLDVIVENFDRYFFSDLSVAALWEMLPVVDEVATGSIGNYVMSGELVMAMKYFTSNFFDQQQRQNIISEVYGVEVPQQRLNSHGYLNYLVKGGFELVKAVHICDRVVAWAKNAGYSGELLQTAQNARLDAIDALSAVDDTLTRNATVKAEKMTSALKQAVANLKKGCGYPEKLSWAIVQTDHWYMDPAIQQYYEIDWN